MTVTLTDVSKTIRGIEIIKPVSMTLHGGIITGLRGVNGSGKTMLMRLIAGLIRPTTGEVEVDGKKLWQDISFPGSIGVLIENPAFLDYYTGFENLKVLASIQNRASDEDIRENIRRVGLNPDDKKKYKKYSLGMKQRLGIAAAVFEKPEIILLDEPTNALDTNGVAMVKNVLSEEKARGALIVLACHDPAVLRELSDEIYSVEEGSIRKLDKAEE